LGASFQIGRSALAAYQSALALTGQNIANVGNANYTRQSAQLTALAGGYTLGGIVAGTGVGIDALRRHLDEALESRLRLAQAERSGAQTCHELLSRIENIYNELGDSDLSSQLGGLFSAFSSLQTDPTDTAARNTVLTSAASVVATLQRQRSGVLGIVSDLNDGAVAATEQVNDSLRQIAQLNQQIVAASARGRGGDSALRDQRDALLRGLSEVMDLQTREQANGSLNVYVGSQPLVEFSQARTLTTARVRVNGVERMDIRFADDNSTVPVSAGQLGALVAARNTASEQVQSLDQLANGLIYEVNRVHASGVGLAGYTQLTGSYAVADFKAPLNSAAAGLAFPIQNGSFVVHLRNQTTGLETTQLVKVDLDGVGAADISLADLAARLDAVPGLQAGITTDNRLQLNADSGYEVSFTEDSSGALAALGLAGFFTGTDAATIQVADAVRNNPNLIAAGLNGAPGDGGNAGLLAAVGTRASALLGGNSVQDFHAGLVSRLATETAAAQAAFDAEDTVYSGLRAQRESTSGVNLDEEAINLTMFERSFQGASRYLSVVNSLADEVLNLVQ
jgi:flagellar hook-associated protein 1 FlgK